MVKGSGVVMKFAQLGGFLESLASIRFIYWIDSMIMPLPPLGTDNQTPYFLLVFVFNTTTEKLLFWDLIYAIFSVCFLLFTCVAAPWAVPEKWGPFTIIAKVWCLDIWSLADTDAA